MTNHVRYFPARSHGFTLVEMAVVLLIVGLLLSGLIPSISNQVEQKRITETRQQLEEIKDALMGFAIINGRLPCPASATSNGEEGFAVGGDASNGNCSNFYDGFVPAATLGIAVATDNQGRAIDAWNNPIHYAVTTWDKTTTPTVDNVYTINNGMATAGISALKPGLKVCSLASCAAGTTLTVDDSIPAVLFSTGKNGANGGTGTDEAANLDNNPQFVSHTPTPTTAANGEFDDIVTWVSNLLLLNRMVTAGKLP